MNSANIGQGPPQKCALHGDIEVNAGMCQRCFRMDGNIRQIMLDLKEIKKRLAEIERKLEKQEG